VLGCSSGNPAGATTSKKIPKERRKKEGVGLQRQREREEFSHGKKGRADANPEGSEKTALRASYSTVMGGSLSGGSKKKVRSKARYCLGNGVLNGDKNGKRKT